MAPIRESHLVILAVVAVGLVMLLLAWSGWVTHLAALQAMRGRTDELAGLVERHSVQVFTEARGLAAAADIALARRDPEALPQDRGLWDTMRHLTDAADTVQTLSILDSSGRIILTTLQYPPPEVVLPDDADVRAAMAEPGLFIGGRRPGPLTRRMLFTLGTRLAGGKGVVMMGVEIERLRALYARVPAGPSVFFGLYRTDGEELFNIQPGQQTNADSGLGAMVSAIVREAAGRDMVKEVDLPEGGRLALALRRMEGLPVFAVAGLDPTREVKTWYATALSAAPAGVVITLFIVAFTSLAIRQVRRERAANTALVTLNSTLEEAVAERTARLHQALEEQSRHAALAEAATLAKSRFLTAIGHDMRQPMQALGLYRQSLAKRVADDPDAAAVVERMGEAITVSEDLLNSLMEIGRIEAGQVVISPAELPFTDLASSLEGLSANGRLRVVPCRAVLWADRVVLGRIVANLVANALKHGRGGRVLVGCRRAADGGLRLMVCDQGCGIPTDKLDAIFEEFYQLDNASRSRDKGLGLGLSIARRLAVACGYGMTVKSSPRGSVFSVHVPAEAVRSWPVGGSRGLENATPAARRRPLSRPAAD